MSDLEYQAATLATRYAALWIAGAHVFVGILQCAVVAWGIRAMVRANDERAAGAAEDRREAREDRREAREDRETARREADQRHAETMEAFKAQARALEVLIERTAPGAAQ